MDAPAAGRDGEAQGSQPGWAQIFFFFFFETCISGAVGSLCGCCPNRGGRSRPDGQAGWHNRDRPARWGLSYCIPCALSASEAHHSSVPTTGVTHPGTQPCPNRLGRAG